MKRIVAWIAKGERVMWLVYILLACMILGPLLLPGYILTLDMAFVPFATWPDDVRSSYAFHAALSLFGHVIPVDWLQKVVLLVILVGSGVGAHRLLQWLGTQLNMPSQKWVPYLAGLLYMVNPFVYARFMAGHYAVLLGYALLPFFVHALLIFITKPTKKAAFFVALWTIAISIVSIHMLGPVVVAISVAAFITVWRHRSKLVKLKPFIIYSGLGAIIFLAASSYWLVPLALGQGSTAGQIQQFTAADREAFATSGGDAIGALSNIIRLQGFWVEARGLFILPQHVVPVWGLLGLVVIAVVIIGFLWMWRRKRSLAAFFAGNGMAVILLALGTTHGWIGQINTWLTDYVPLFAGFREPHKFIALLALSYAVFFAVGCRVLVERVSSHLCKQIMIVIVLAVPFVWTPTMAWGFAGQLRTSQYPQDWYTVKTLLNEQHSQTSVLFLPWHQYMELTTAGRIVAIPSENFFGNRIIASHDPEYGNLGPEPSYPGAKIMQDTILPSAGQADFAARLSAAHVSFVVLAKEYDYQKYDYLNHSPGFTRVYDGEDMALYSVDIKETN